MPDLWMDVDANLAEAPINILPLIDATDFKTIEDGLTYDQAGLDLVWNFVTTAGAFTQTAVTPTEAAGNYDWTNEGNGMYAIEIPASGGASINNDTEGFGWFTGYATGVLPWRGPVIGFRAAGLNNVLIDTAYSATRGLAGTALPDAAADGVGGLVISDAGGLDIDAKLANAVPTVAQIQAEMEEDGASLLDTIADSLPANFADLSITATTGKVSISRPTGSVIADVGNTASTFKVDLAGGSDAYNRQWLRFTSGALAGEVSRIADFDGGTDFVTVADAYSDTPSDGDDFELINE